MIWLFMLDPETYQQNNFFKISEEIRSIHLYQGNIWMKENVNEGKNIILRKETRKFI
jgi:hypothetical protein